MTIFEEQANKMRNILKCALLDKLITEDEYHNLMKGIK